MRTISLLLGFLLAGCEAGSDQNTIDLPGEAGPALQSPPVPPSPEQMAALGSHDCVEVVQLYFEAIGGRNWDLAARVWNDPAIDASRLERLYGDYREAQFEWNEPFVEGAAGTLYCNVSGVLSDAQGASTLPLEGTLLLRRVNDVPGATAQRLRWTLQSSTFVEPLHRSDESEP